MIQMHRSIRVTGGTGAVTDDAVVIEDRFGLVLNGSPVTDMVASRDQLRELGAGYVITEGLARCVDAVALDGDRILVSSSTCCDPGIQERETGSSGGTSFLSALPLVDSEIRITPDDVVSITQGIETELWRKTGGVHCSVLWQDGRLVAKSSDVGRHNTVDKLVGHAVLNNVDLSRCVIGCTGRQPAGMVRKCVRAGIPVIVSRAASTDKGIATAAAAGITLIGFSRGDRFTIYTHPGRVSGIGTS